MKFTELSKEQLTNKINFVKKYAENKNAADSAKFDPNANVTSKNVSTLAAKMYDDFTIQINRGMMYEKLEELFSKDVADKYIEQLNEHLIYAHDETGSPGMPYCASISMYPFLTRGLLDLGGESEAPKHIESYCGCFVNLVFSIASQFRGAVATPEFLVHFDHFASKDYGDNYLENFPETIGDHLQHVVYALNQPAAARNYQSCFWNISIYDREYFNGIFGDFYYPDDFSQPSFESVSKLQDFFMDWFNKEREKCVLTFPVVTSAMLVDETGPKDKEYAISRARDLAAGNSFFTYMSDSPDSLASCCRLRNELIEKPEFSYSLGAGGLATGSTNVITLNMNRLEQTGVDLLEQIQLMHKYQVAHRKILEWFVERNLLPAYSSGFISLEKQFLTIGINGLVEAAEFRGLKISNNEEYKEFIDNRLSLIYKENREANKVYGYRFNTEMVPAEGLGVKFAKWDKEDGLVVPRDCYNSYFYIVEEEMTNPLIKFLLHGKDFVSNLDGGSALHLNLDEHLDIEQYLKIMSIAANCGCNYWTINVKNTACNCCGYIDKRTLTSCSKCGSIDVDYCTRVIGYLKKVSSFSKERREEHSRRSYSKV